MARAGVARLHRPSESTTDHDLDQGKVSEPQHETQPRLQYRRPPRSDHVGPQCRASVNTGSTAHVCNGLAAIGMAAGGT